MRGRVRVWPSGGSGAVGGCCWWVPLVGALVGALVRAHRACVDVDVDVGAVDVGAVDMGAVDVGAMDVDVGAVDQRIRRRSLVGMPCWSFIP